MGKSRPGSAPRMIYYTALVHVHVSLGVPRMIYYTATPSVVRDGKYTATQEWCVMEYGYHMKEGHLSVIPDGPSWSI